MAEYYIRQPDSEEARGPFDLQRIADLVEANQVDTSTLYYDEDRDDWFPIVDSLEMRDVVFPEKKHLSLKAKEMIDTVNYREDELPVVTVDELLAAAEGNTDDTKHLKAKEQSRDKAAGVSLPMLGLMMLLNGFAILWPQTDLIVLLYDERDYSILLHHPLLAVGLLDAFLMLCCFLNVTDAFPIIRGRAMVGLGYFCYINWAYHDTQSFLAAALSSTAIYVCTITLSFPLMMAAVGIGIVSSGALAFFAFLG